MTEHAEHLAQAQRHLVDGERRVARQELLVTELALGGRDIADAKLLLRTFRESLALMRVHLQQEISDRAR